MENSLLTFTGPTLFSNLFAINGGAFYIQDSSHVYFSTDAANKATVSYATARTNGGFMYIGPTATSI